jgi:hypothetical protein
MSGTIYIIWVREFLRLNEPIYKLGRTENIINRVMQYPKGSRLLCSIYCDDEKKIETLLKRKFNIEFKARPDFGAEYFEGNINKMIEIIYKYVLQNSNNDLDNMDNISITLPEVKIKKDPTIVIMEYVNDNREFLSNKIMNSKDLYNNITEWIVTKKYDINIIHSKMITDLIKCYGIITKIHQFESGIDQAVIFPNLIKEIINEKIGNIKEFCNEYIMKSDSNQFIELKDIKIIFQKSEYYNGEIQFLKNELQKILNTTCITRIRTNQGLKSYVFKGFIFKENEIIDKSIDK